MPGSQVNLSYVFLTLYKSFVDIECDNVKVHYMLTYRSVLDKVIVVKPTKKNIKHFIAYTNVCYYLNNCFFFMYQIVFNSVLFVP